MIAGWTWAAVAVIVATAATHSVMGERRLIGPILAIDQGVLRMPLARQLIRFAWHFTSVLMLALAFALVVLMGQTGRPAAHVFAAIGIAFLAVGVFDAVYTRGKHIGWPLLVGSGACALLALS